MKISQLQTKVQSVFKNYSLVGLTNLWKSDKAGQICIGISAQRSSGFFSFGEVGRIMMDYSGNVLDYRSDDGKEKTLAFLKGVKIDLNSFEHDYQKIIKNKAVGVEKCDYLGTIDENGKAIFFNKTNIEKYPLSESYSGKYGVETHGNPEYLAIYRNFLKKNKKNITSTKIFHDNITYHTVNLKIQGYEVCVSFQEFFSFDLDVRIYSNKKDKNGDNTSIKLQGADVVKFDQVMNEIKSGNFSIETMARIITDGISSSRYVDLDLSKEVVVAKMNFDGWHGRPRGRYEFHLDFKNKKVVTPKSRSTKFIPSVVERMNKEMKEINKTLELFAA